MMEHPRLAGYLIAFALFCVIGWWVYHVRRAELREQISRLPHSASSPKFIAPLPREIRPLPALQPGAERSHLADQLNSTNHPPMRDLEIVHDVLFAFRTTFDEMPVGTNDEIVRSLAGDNKLGLAFLPPDSPAINDKNELVDRWRTPFFFHQISASQMEIRSAGPDRTLWTADDLIR